MEEGSASEVKATLWPATVKEVPEASAAICRSQRPG